MYIIKTHFQKRSQDGLQNRYKIFELVFFYSNMVSSWRGYFLLYKCDIFFNIWSEANCQTNKNNDDKRTPRKLILNIKTQFCYCVTL